MKSFNEKIFNCDQRWFADRQLGQRSRSRIHATDRNRGRKFKADTFSFTNFHNRHG